jgi:hypothetical protein
MRGRDERIRLTGLVLIVAVLIVRLSYDASNRDIGIRSYALVNMAIVLGATGIVARKRRAPGSHTIHLN